MELAQLVEDCKKQQQQAQKALFNRFSGALLSVCNRYLNDKVAAEAALLAGFLKIFQNLDGFNFEGEQKCYAWMKRIVVNECLMELRKQQKFLFNTIEPSEADVSEDGFKLSAFDTGIIIKAISALPEGFRTVFNLYVIEGFSHKEIAGILSISESTSKSQLNRAKAALREQLQQYNFDR